MRARFLLLVSALILSGCGSVIDESAATSAPSDAPSVSAEETMPEPEPAPSSSDETPDIDFGILPKDEPEEPQMDGDSAVEGEAPSDSDEDSSDQGPSNGEPSMGAAMSGMPTDPDNPGFRLGPTFADENGTFHRVVMPDSCDRITDPIILSQSELAVTDRELRRALVLTGRFAAEELAASELAFNYTSDGAEAWLEDHKDMFLHPELVEAGLLNTETPNQSLALLYTDNGWERGTPERPSRIQNLDVQLVSVKEDGEALIISHLVTFEAEVRGAGGLSGTYTEKTRIHTTYTVEQVDGQWKIADYEAAWDTQY